MLAGDRTADSRGIGKPDFSEVAEARLRTPDPNHPAANRDAALYHRVKAAFEPITREKLDLDTTHGADSVLTKALAWLNT